MKNMIKKISGTLKHGKLPAGSLAVVASLWPRQRKADVPAGSKRRAVVVLIAVAAGVAVVLGVFIMCLFTLDKLPVLKYKVSPVYSALGGVGGQLGIESQQGTGSQQGAGALALNVRMTISVPLFSKKEYVYLFMGDMDINVQSCTDTWGNTKEAFLDEGIVTIPVSRGSTTTMVYDVRIGVPAKHGARGMLTDTYVVFDGDQAFLLPAEFNIFSDRGVRDSAARIEFEFNFPAGWKEIVPFKKVDNPAWADIYAITKNAFVFGEFEEVSVQGIQGAQSESGIQGAQKGKSGGLKVYALEGQLPLEEDISGFSAMYSYYANLIGSEPPEYNIVLLPSGGNVDFGGDEGFGGQVIGGSGTRTVAASFDSGLRRDWQLLSHRLFHAFFDNAAPYVEVHIPLNLWMYEGLCTYYENLATDAIPEPLKSKLDIDVNRQEALTFNQYVYMRLKEPFIYNFAPMDEDRLTSAAMTEFLHYTVAPLVVKAFEDASIGVGNPPDSLLRYLLSEGAYKEGYAPISAAFDLLGDDRGAAFCDSYMLGLEFPPLWGLAAWQPSAPEVLESLNYIETLLANWHQADNPDYAADIVSLDELVKAMDVAGDGRIPATTEGFDAIVRNYCPEVYAIVKDYYRRAELLGIEPDDRDLRAKMALY